MAEPFSFSQIVSLSGNKIKRNCNVVMISFSAHVDYRQNRDFINMLNPSHVVRSEVKNETHWGAHSVRLHRSWFTASSLK